MTQQSTVERDGRAIPYIQEGDGPVSLVLLTNRSLEGDGLGVVTHYLDEEAGFHLVRIGLLNDEADADAIADVVAVLDHVGLASTWIGGHGVGGTVARAFATEQLDRTNGLLLLGVEPSEQPLAPQIPVLIIQGADDTVTPPANGEALQATAPERASVKNLDGADHLFPVTHPIQTAFIIEEYLDWD